jgi:hypothetical protein
MENRPLMIFAVLLGIVLVLTQCSAFADEPSRNPLQLTQEQAVMVYAAAYGDMKYIPEQAPTVRVTTKEVLHEVCKCGYPNVKGAYLDGVVYVDGDLDFGEPLNVSILYHEFIHYVQAMRDGPTHGCDMSMAREREAYGLQSTFLWKHFQIRFQPPNLPTCI